MIRPRIQDWFAPSSLLQLASRHSLALTHVLTLPPPQATEILVALKKLGDALQPKEEAFLQQHMTDTLSAFEEVQDVDGVSKLPTAQ